MIKLKVPRVKLLELEGSPTQHSLDVEMSNEDDQLGKEQFTAPPNTAAKESDTSAPDQAQPEKSKQPSRRINNKKKALVPPLDKVRTGRVSKTPQNQAATKKPTGKNRSAQQPPTPSYRKSPERKVQGEHIPNHNPSYPHSISNPSRLSLSTWFQKQHWHYQTHNYYQQDPALVPLISILHSGFDLCEDVHSAVFDGDGLVRVVLGKIEEVVEEQTKMGEGFNYGFEKAVFEIKMGLEGII
ncbi:hypothetical protein BDV96DRAFT_564669 [Lophiotrema nucula]|uniref:Uncharacterized protein n=1 Tax=Lophiotrema nucula TaxID=690887 RepID=A0A6A5ZTK9_9PLEO|nr:hypothetical protein BDV96DRAFT_564669 [Lophiotrema nucula]